MKQKTPFLWVSLTPYSSYDRIEKCYVGYLSTIIFSGITWECQTKDDLPFVLHVAVKKEPYLQLGLESFDLMKCSLDREDDLHDIKLSLPEAARFLNYLIYEYTAELDLRANRKKAFRYKFYDVGNGKNAFKPALEKIKAKELISESDLEAIAKYNFRG